MPLPIGVAVRLSHPPQILPARGFHRSYPSTYDNPGADAYLGDPQSQPSSFHMPAFLVGLLPTSWVHTQSAYARSNGPPTPLGPAWSVLLIKFIWQSTLDGWQARCQQAHNSEKSLEKELLASKVEQLYTRASQLPPHEYSLVLPEPRTAVLSRTSTYQRSWLAVTTHAVNGACHRANRRRRYATQPITAFFELRLAPCPLVPLRPWKVDRDRDLLSRLPTVHTDHIDLTLPPAPSVHQPPGRAPGCRLPYWPLLEYK